MPLTMNPAISGASSRLSGLRMLRLCLQEEQLRSPLVRQPLRSLQISFVLPCLRQLAEEAGQPPAFTILIETSRGC